MSEIPTTDVALVGAGPIGLEMAVELKRARLDYLHFDKGQIGSTIAWFPNGMTFFSSTDRIEIADQPIQTVDQSKASRDQYLAYLRSVVLEHDLKINSFEQVLSVRKQGDADDAPFLLKTRTRGGERQYLADRVILAIGDMHRPRKLGIEGEDLDHVSHYFRDPHLYFRRKLLVVGGKNSAVEAALRCYHAGAQVSMSYRQAEFNKRSVKYWLLPELIGRIHRDEITCHYKTVPTRITDTHVTLQHPDGRHEDVEADFVLMMTGYVADMSLFEGAGAKLRGETRTPVFDEQTMQTTVPGLYVAGTATAGTQQSYKVFIENCHIHTKRIAAALTGQAPPPPPKPLTVPES